MFGNRPLPNNAPSLLLFLPPPPDSVPAPPPLPSASRAPAWAKRWRAHRRRRRPPTTPRHRRRRSPRHRLSTVPTSAAPSSRDVGERHPPRHSPPTPLRATVKRHITHRQRHPPVPRHTRHKRPPANATSRRLRER